MADWKFNALIDGVPERLVVNGVIVATGFLPDLDMLGELRLDLETAVESPRLLAPRSTPTSIPAGPYLLMG